MPDTYDEVKEAEKDFRDLVLSLGKIKWKSKESVMGDVLFNLFKDGYTSISPVGGEEGIVAKEKFFRVMSFIEAFKEFCTAESAPGFAGLDEEKKLFGAYETLSTIYSRNLGLTDDVLMHPSFIKSYETSFRGRMAKMNR